MERIIERFAQLEEKLESDQPPEREYFLRYPEELADDLFNLGQLSKTRYDKFNYSKNELIGDFKCGYCPYSEICYSKGAQTDISQDTNLTARLKRLNSEEADAFLKGE